MTEAEWLAYADPDPWRRVNHPMLAFLESIGRASERKLRLFAVACCRLLSQKVRVHTWDIHRVNVAERYADGAASADELRGTHKNPPDNWLSQVPSVPDSNLLMALSEWNQSSRNARSAFWNAVELEFGILVAECVATCAAWGATVPGTVMPDDNGVSEARLVAELAVQCDLIRCIFGNPFRPTAIDPRWQTTSVVGVAQGVYAERAFGYLPILADALEDAGCCDQGLLGHLRGPGPHDKGCWAVDLILGKQ
jgi:hypothetical protein